MALDPTDSLPRWLPVAGDRTSYDRQDQLRALAFHLDKINQHHAMARSIIEEFGLPVELPGNRDFLASALRVAVLRNR